MNQELSEAYRRTTYYADTPRGRLAIHIGQFDAELDRLLADHGCRAWAYLTAHNPRSQRLSADENQRRQARLERELRAGGWICFSGEGVGARGDWPPEISTLVLGVDEATATRLGEVFEQNAIVVGQFGKPAALALLG
ncbi:MAG TPA: DUF3293 domain-containing protein [Pirellulales bacterium]|nr:DUF3293 domain-containing protein [Pirellulales bacterium]